MTTSNNGPRVSDARDLMYQRYQLVRPEDEEAVLNAILSPDKEMRVQLISALDESNFYDKENKVKFLSSQRQAGRARDLNDNIALAAEARRIVTERRIKDVNLHPGDFGKMRKAKPTSDIEEAVRNLKQADLGRQIVEAATWALDEVQSGTMELDALIEGWKDKISGIVPPKPDRRIHYGHDMVDSIVANIKTRKAARAAGKILYIDFPWDSWNRQIGMHVPGKILLFAMPDGHGKSTFGVQMAEHLAGDRDLETFIIALEDNIDSIQARLVAKHCRIPFARFIAGDISDEEEVAIERIMRDKMPRKLHFLTMPGASASEVLRELETQTFCNHKPQAVIIDYLEALRPSGKSMREHNNDLYSAQGADIMDFVAYSSAESVPFVCFDQLRKDFLGLPEKEKRKRGRSMIAGSVDKSRASQIIIIGENKGPKDGDTTSGISQLELWVDKANNSSPNRKLDQYLHGPTYTIKDML